MKQQLVMESKRFERLRMLPGHFMLIQAHRLAPASALAPFMYTQIVWMIAVGYLFFGDVPDLWTLVGAAIVVASGLFVFAGEARALRAPAAA